MFKPKSSKNDCTAAQLPHTRKEVFFDVLKMNWKSFLVYGILMLIFMLPGHIFAIFENTTVSNLTVGFEKLTPEEQKNIFVQILAVKNIRAVLDIISYLIVFLGVAGIGRIIRQHAWEEPVFFGSDFTVGIKSNAGQMVLLGLLSGALNFVSVYLKNIAALIENYAYYLILSLFANVLIFVAIPIVLYSAVSILIYKKKFHKHLLTAFLITAKAPFKSLFAIICCALPFCIQLIPNSYCFIFGRVFASVLSPLIMLGWLLFSFNRLDEFINKEHYPELVGRGTFPVNEENDSDSSTSDEE